MVYYCSVRGYEEELFRMPRSKRVHYSVMLPPPVEEDLNELTEELHISKAEALRRSIVLLKHAIKAKRVELEEMDGTKRAVVVR